MARSRGRRPDRIPARPQARAPLSAALRAALPHHPQLVARVEGIFDRHGGKAIILGRFIGVARAITPFLAGSSHLPLRRFLAFDIAGAGAWAATFLAVGYVVAASASGAASLSRSIGYAIGGAALLGGIALGIRLLDRSAPRGARLRLALRWARAALIPERDAGSQ